MRSKWYNHNYYYSNSLNELLNNKCRIHSRWTFFRLGASVCCLIKEITYELWSEGIHKPYWPRRGRGRRKGGRAPKHLRKRGRARLMTGTLPRCTQNSKCTLIIPDTQFWNLPKKKSFDNWNTVKYLLINTCVVKPIMNQMHINLD